MKFIKLTRYHNDGLIFISIDKIESIQPTSNYEKGLTSTTIVMFGNSKYEVNESPEQILDFVEILDVFMDDEAKAYAAKYEYNKNRPKYAHAEVRKHGVKK